jgi:hypothetical protein
MAVAAASEMSDNPRVNEPMSPGPSLPMRLLQAGVPLTLLLDLTAQEGPDSSGISARERPED